LIAGTPSAVGHSHTASVFEGSIWLSVTLENAVQIAM